MSEKVEDGGPAFPHQFEDVSGHPRWKQSQGLSLRDWFAGQALSAAWSARDKGYYDGDDRDMASCAYQIADAMIQARKAGA